MLKKNYELLFIPLVLLAIILSIIFHLPLASVIHASECEYDLLINGVRHRLPETLYLCEYNYQEDAGYIIKKDYIYVEKGKRVWGPNHYTITDSESLSLLTTRITGYDFRIDEEGYNFHGDDALPSTFLIIVTPDAIIDENEEYYLSPTISGVRASPIVKELIMPLNDEYTFELVAQASSLPVIDGYEGVYITSVENPASVSEIRNLLTAYDDVDGDISANIILISDEYSENCYTIGLYPLVFSVSDSSSNTSTITIYVSVIDNVCPIINGPSVIESYLSSSLSIQDIKATISVNDNYDGDITSSLTIHSDDYTTNKNTVGQYEVVFKAIDGSLNTSYKTITVKVIDDVKPMISGNVTYTKATTAVLTSASIKDNLIATDAHDGDLTSYIKVIEDTYTNNESTVGNYVIKYQVLDKANNESDIFVVTIFVKDFAPPVFYVDGRIINIASYELLTHDTIITYLTLTNQIDSSKDYTYTFLVNEYTGNEKVAGDYQVSVKLNYEDNKEDIINLTIRVHDEIEAVNTNNIVDDIPTKINFFTKSWRLIKRSFSSIGAFFAKAWNWFINIF